MGLGTQQRMKLEALRVSHRPAHLRAHASGACMQTAGPAHGCLPADVPHHFIGVCIAYRSRSVCMQQSELSSAPLLCSGSHRESIQGATNITSLPHILTCIMSGSGSSARRPPALFVAASAPKILQSHCHGLFCHLIRTSSDDLEILCACRRVCCSRRTAWGAGTARC